ncbi:hypothetical protein [Streptomyces sp. NPDC026673]|uniref:hypothetical protein n=1 Tax=Streptomyces sp. NPDC026673 TaxID=3155724 RepID=UPI0033FFD0A7
MSRSVMRPPSRRAGAWTAVAAVLAGILLILAVYLSVVFWYLTHNLCFNGPGCPAYDALDVAVYGAALGLLGCYFAVTAVVLARRGFGAATGVQVAFLTGWLILLFVLALELLAR